MNRQVESLEPTATLPKISPPPSPPSIPQSRQPKIPIPVSSMSTPMKLIRRQSPTLPKISPPPIAPGLPVDERPKLPIPVSTLGSPPVRRNAQGTPVFVTASTANGIVPLLPPPNAGPTGLGHDGSVSGGMESNAHGGMDM